MAASTAMISNRVRILLRATIALVWLYQGFWNKFLVVRVLGWDDRHLRIMQQAFGEGLGSLALHGLAAVETLLAVAVMLRYQPVATAWSQLLLLLTMNTAGIVFAAADIPDIGGMVTMNAAFGVAIWINGQLSREGHE
jgi:hypothetical protein